MDPYTVLLNDTMTVSSGTQQLEIDGEWNTSSTTPMWTVFFLDDSTFNVFTYDTNGTNIDSYYGLPCASGIVQITVTSDQITFTGATTQTVSTVTFQNLVQIATYNEGGASSNFTGGELDMTLTTP
jgi:hypothetical protein